MVPENGCRQGREKGANPDTSGRAKIPGFGGRQNLVTFQLKSYSKCDDFGPQQARGPSGGFSGGPRRDVRRAARRDLQDDQRHHPRALVHHVFVLSRCLRFSSVRLFFVTSSSVRFSFCVQMSDWIFFCVQRSDEKIVIRPLDVLAGPGHVVGRRSRRACTVDARSFT